MDTGLRLRHARDGRHARWALVHLGVQLRSVRWAYGAMAGDGPSDGCAVEGDASLVSHLIKCLKPLQSLALPPMPAKAGIHDARAEPERYGPLFSQGSSGGGRGRLPTLSKINLVEPLDLGSCDAVFHERKAELLGDPYRR